MIEQLGSYLQESAYCDYTNPKILSLSQEITSDCKDVREKAVKLFFWVRDSIDYRVGLWNAKASETLLIGQGTCTNKSNLLVALLRAAKIPAGYGRMKVNGKEYFGPIAIPLLKNFVSDVSTHFYVLVNLNDRWVKCDPSDDRRLSEATYHYNYTTKMVNWDGRKNAMLNIRKDHIIEDRYPIANIDSLIKKRIKFWKLTPVKVANYYINFLRTNKTVFSSITDAEKSFKLWMRQKHFLLYCFILSFSIIKNKLDII